MKEQRIQLYKALINRLLASTDIQVISNITTIFENFFENSKEIDNFKEIFEALFFDDKENLDILFWNAEKQQPLSVLLNLYLDSLDVQLSLSWQQIYHAPKLLYNKNLQRSHHL